MGAYAYPQFPYTGPADLQAGAPQRRPLIVVGAGPVGLAAAIDARLQGLPVIVFDEIQDLVNLPPGASQQQRDESTLLIRMLLKWALLASHDGHPRSLCSHVGEASGDMDASRTCGAMVMRLVGGEVLAGAGCAQENPPRRLELSRWRGLKEAMA